MHIHFIMLEVVCQEMTYFLNMTLFVRSQSFISLPSFMFVSAAVSEICELNQNKNSEMDFFQFKTFPGHIIYAFFNQGVKMYPCIKFCLPQYFPLSVKCTYICH